MKGKPANDYCSTLTKRNLNIMSFARQLFLVNNFIPGGEAHHYLPAADTLGSRDVHGLFR